MAAIWAAKDVGRVGLVEKGAFGKAGCTPMGAYSVCAAFGFADPADNPRVHLEDTIRQVLAHLNNLIQTPSSKTLVKFDHIAITQIRQYQTTLQAPPFHFINQTQTQLGLRIGGDLLRNFHFLHSTISIMKGENDALQF
jgi:hypothetical protein